MNLKSIECRVFPSVEDPNDSIENRVQSVSLVLMTLYKAESIECKVSPEC